MPPTIGRIVLYRLTNADAERINVRRTDAIAGGAGGARTGYVVHVGNRVAAGEVYPMIITRVWSDPEEVNGQVLLDGNDTLWVTSVKWHPLAEGMYAWPVTE